MAAELCLARPQKAPRQLVRAPSRGRCCDFATVVSIYGDAPALIAARQPGGWASSCRARPARRKVLKGRPRADDAARTVDCLYHCAAGRADRAVLHRLESVPAAIR